MYIYAQQAHTHIHTHTHTHTHIHIHTHTHTHTHTNTHTHTHTHTLTLTLRQVLHGADRVANPPLGSGGSAVPPLPPPAPPPPDGHLGRGRLLVPTEVNGVLHRLVETVVGGTQLLHVRWVKGEDSGEGVWIAIVYECVHMNNTASYNTCRQLVCL